MPFIFLNQNEYALSDFADVDLLVENGLVDDAHPVLDLSEFAPGYQALAISAHVRAQAGGAQIANGDAPGTGQCGGMENFALRASLNGLDWHSLRSIAEDDLLRKLAFSAKGLASWHQNQRFCTRCAEPLRPVAGGWQRSCINAHLEFPRLDPAVIMSVVDHQDRLLLALNQRHQERRMFSVLAGFVAPGESLEDAVLREVKEEVGLEVESPQYVLSQPWPFPRAMMFAFTCRLAPGKDSTLVLQEDELQEAVWVSRAELREHLAAGDFIIPEVGSAARSLIEKWLNFSTSS